jgi:putative YhbY family RNA-binding protein
MAQLILPRDLRLELRAQAHHLDPVVLLGAHGLTDAVRKEVDRALNQHGLIKVRVPSDDREERVAIYEELAETLGAAKIQLIGKLLILYRPVPETEEAGEEETAEKRETVKKVRKTGAKARNARKRLTEKLQADKKAARGAAKNLPWNNKLKKGKTPKGQVKEVGEQGRPLGKRQTSRGF